MGDDSLTCDDEANEVYIIFAGLTIFKFHIQFNPFLSFRMKMKRPTLLRNFRKNWNSTSWNCQSSDLTQGSTTSTMPKTHSVEWLEWQAYQRGVKIRHQYNNTEKRIGARRLPVDGFCSERQTVYQFHGKFMF